jgi:hypothetical protein
MLLTLKALLLFFAARPLLRGASEQQWKKQLDIQIM